MRKYPRLLLLIAVILYISITGGLSPARSDSYTIYFETEREGDSRIYRYTGDDPVAVTEPGCVHPSVTADGSMLLYSRMTETLWGRFWNVFYMVDGEEHKLSTNEIYDEMEPVISRDGTFAAYTTMRAFNLEIITLSLDQNDLQYRITENEKPDEMPALATGDEWVYWTGRTGVNSFIFRAPGLGGGEIERISTDALTWEEHPSVSADGRYIVYSSITPEEDEEDEGEETEEVGGTTGPSRLASAHKYPWMGGDTTDDEDEYEDVESEDDDENGDEEEMLRPEPMEGNSDIWILDRNTGQRTRLTTDCAWDGHPCISADGMVIVFTSDRDDNMEIYRMNRDGSGLTRLTENDAVDDFATIT